jgi:hypothetical protein
VELVDNAADSLVTRIFHIILLLVREDDAENLVQHCMKQHSGGGGAERASRKPRSSRPRKQIHRSFWGHGRTREELNWREIVEVDE